MRQSLNHNNNKLNNDGVELNSHTLVERRCHAPLYYTFAI